jgi:hypothetical protein
MNGPHWKDRRYFLYSGGVSFFNKVDPDSSFYHTIMKERVKVA